jgi:hypothetical protein
MKLDTKTLAVLGLIARTPNFENLKNRLELVIDKVRIKINLDGNQLASVDVSQE